MKKNTQTYSRIFALPRYFALALVVSFFMLGPGLAARGKAANNNVGLVISTLNNPFFVALKEGAEAEAQTQGIQLIILDSQNDPAKELSNVEDLISRQVRILLLNPADSDAAARTVKRANESGISVITLDRSASSGEVMSHIASDNVSGGEMAAKFIIEQLDVLGKGTNVVELEGLPGTNAARDRGTGFNRAAKGKLNIVARQAADFDRTKGLNVMEDILQGQNDIAAVFAHNDEMALGALRAIEGTNRSILVVGFDATDDAVAAVKAGQMAATVAQQPRQIGALGVDAAAKILAGQAVAKMIPVALSLVTE